MNWLRRIMYGRYGNDQFGYFLFAVYLFLFLLQVVFRGSIVSSVFIMLSYLVILLSVFFQKHI